MKHSPVILPDLREFKKKAQQGNLIPVYCELCADTETPVSAFMKLNTSRNCFLLESVEGGEKWARYSFIGLSPSLIFISRGTDITLKKGRSITRMYSSNPMLVLRKIMQTYRPVPTEGLPRFFGGAVGYVAYDMVRFFERLPDTTRDDLKWPDAYFMITDTLLIFDNIRHNVKVVANVHLDDTQKPLEKAYAQAVASIKKTIALLNKPLRSTVRRETQKRSTVSSNTSRDIFRAMVSKARNYIKAGDIIQVVLSQRFSTRLHTSPFELYRALRIVNPSPYMYFMQLGDVAIVGSSPEVLVRLEHDEIVVRPIAGTRPRGTDDREDAALEQELRNDPKERAEHIMLVDLGRNDVGRVAEIGTVRVDDLMTVERYSHVMHLVSNVRGTLKKGCDAFDVFMACFPAGTVSGAPKIRAMEIIEELERHRRGPYAGAVGYFSFSGNMDFCITIRTMLVKNKNIYIQAGAGIVLDSDPDREYQETVNKARGMLKAIHVAHRGL